MTWHEVSVLKKGEAAFEYVNCNPEIGMIRSIPLKKSPLQDNKFVPVHSA